MTPLPAESGPGRVGARGRLVAVIGLLDRPLTSYYLVLGCSMLLLALGLTMVLASSNVDQLERTGSAFTLLQKQAAWIGIGLPVMWLASKLPPRTFRALAYPLLLLSVIGLVIVLIPGLGVSAWGATRWIDVGPFQVQPSEPAKLGLVLWGADLMARRERLGQLTDWRALLIPLLPGAGVVVMLVMLGSDLGTTVVLLTIFLTLLWVVGAPVRLFVGMAGLIGLLVAILIVVEPYRMQRLVGFLDSSGDPLGIRYQGNQGLLAVASGGWFGTGLGEGRAQWGFLPRAENDFIFAIIGEQLGLVGTLVVLGLFGLLAYAGLRIARRVRDPFMRLAAAAVTGWLSVQAIVNIGGVIGVLPITGIPLPLVSYGGSAMIPTLAALGMLLAFAQREPGARQALAARGPGPARRALSWLGLARR
ncbi:MULTISPECIES: putative lipid II flippase FtsW [Thermomonospora]|uniref:Probable peptidoglycan glycosyltransferase FtsW n=1 Tax=Thermomonospora curvata (strain ATCC 19995 / DSM 43183 / JCM 3096 / KCTC 9072 / NBRC 15933 / NCIMB 10081 / Henssen B9) TaxID=471852 RepID=D1A7U7_THECD|nr:MULTISPECIES: putative lipid II flippase FtsW [Thermomonospora]ACY98469.1 cell division protein FtsW [Thermomonospora curvata DSM 43183]PKK13616.1 MAG: putative lipid II flippase FtsW [Thermomonospora sp. CIF 1]